MSAAGWTVGRTPGQTLDALDEIRERAELVLNATFAESIGSATPERILSCDDVPDLLALVGALKAERDEHKRAQDEADARALRFAEKLVRFAEKLVSIADERDALKARVASANGEVQDLLERLRAEAQRWRRAFGVDPSVTDWTPEAAAKMLDEACAQAQDALKCPHGEANDCHDMTALEDNACAACYKVQARRREVAEDERDEARARYQDALTVLRAWEPAMLAWCRRFPEKPIPEAVAAHDRIRPDLEGK